MPNAAATLAAGVTTVRDAGHTPVGVRLAAEAGYFPAPRMELAVSLLSQTGGHGDDLMPCGARVGLTMDSMCPHGVVDGVDGMRRKVRQVLQAGADWIKLCTSGGVLSPGDLPDHAQFSVEEIRDGGRRGRGGGQARDGARHVPGRASATRSSPGVTSIEHGCLLDEEGIALMKEKGAYLVPTLVAPGDVIDRRARRRWAAGRDDRQGGANPGPPSAAVSAAIASGVKVAMGTDAAVGPHGKNLRELG